jgi:type I restriction enzyme S subunit
MYGVNESAQREGTYKLLRITDIQNDSVDWNLVPYTNYSGIVEPYFLQKGDIVFARTGATVGKSFLIQSPPSRAIYASYLIRVRFVLPALAEYIKVFFGTPCYWSQITQKTVGTGQPNVNGTSLAGLLLPLPPLNEQKRIVSQVESLLKYIDEIDENAVSLENTISLTKQKILDLAIRGKLVPQDPNDEPASELLKRIKAEKETLIKSGKLKRDKHESFIFRGDDNCYHENVDGKSVDITDMIPFNLPDSWEWVRLASLGSVIGGGTPSTSVPDYWDGAIPWLSPCDLSDYKGKYISRGKRNISQKGLDHSSAVLMPSGSILYSSRAPIGYVVIASNQISTNQGFKSLVPIVDGMDEFIYYTLKALTPDIRKRATGTTFKEISGSEFGKTMLPLPPLAEQKRIVSQIEKLFSILETMHG